MKKKMNKFANRMSTFNTNICTINIFNINIRLNCVKTMKLLLTMADNLQVLVFFPENFVFEILKKKINILSVLLVLFFLFVLSKLKTNISINQKKIFSIFNSQYNILFDRYIYDLTDKKNLKQTTNTKFKLPTQAEQVP